MQNVNPNKTARRLMVLISTAAIALPLSIGMASTAHAAECSPIQLSRIQMYDAKPVYQGSAITGVSVKIASTIKNTNATRGHAKSWGAFAYTAAFPSYGTHQRVHNDRLSRDLYGGQSQGIGGRTFVFKRNPGNLAQLTVKLEGFAHNPQCPTGKQRNDSVFIYDLMPVINGGKPKLVRGTLRGYTESRLSRPRPRPGTGAPRPRT